MTKINSAEQTQVALSPEQYDSLKGKVAEMRQKVLQNDQSVIRDFVNADPLLRREFLAAMENEPGLKRTFSSLGSKAMGANLLNRQEGVSAQEFLRATKDVTPPSVTIEVTGESYFAPGAPNMAAVAGVGTEVVYAEPPSKTKGDLSVLDGMSSGQIVDFATKDPAAFAAFMKELDTEDQYALQMAVQNAMQKVNQMYSLMTSLSQAMHDTSKAVISNMRV